MPKPDAEEKYIQAARVVFAHRFPTYNFDDCSWDIRQLRSSQHKKTNARVYFTLYGSTSTPLPEAFASVVKAFLLLTDSSAGTMPLRADAARMLWKAISKRLERNTFSWMEVREDDLLETEQHMLQSWGAAATHKSCTRLQRMIDTLAAAPYGPIVRPIKATLRTSRPEDFERYTLAGQELRQRKMPREEAIQAVGRMFTGVAQGERDRLVLCALALLLATGFRVGEVLTLPVDCEVSEDAGGISKYGIRYYKEKSRRGEKRFSVHWLTTAQAELARAAISEARNLTAVARERAKVLEQNPNTVPLPNISPTDLLSRAAVAGLLGCKQVSINTIPPAKLIRTATGLSSPRYVYKAKDLMAYLHRSRAPLWVVDRLDGTYQLLSESLFIQFHNAGHAVKRKNQLLVKAVGQQQINDFLGAGGESRHAIMKSGFERYGFKDGSGKYYSMHSHQFRHWVTTKAAQAGVPDHVIARWQGREHIGDLEAYKHLTPAERLQTLKTALDSGRVHGQLADMYFNLRDDLRDVFLEGQLQAVHITPLGLCIHDFKVTPCPKFLNCVKDCGDYVLDATNEVHISNLVQLKTRTELILDQARQQKMRGEVDLSQNWIAEAEATLAGVKQILNAATAQPTDTLRPFKGKPSKFQQ